MMPKIVIHITQDRGKTWIERETYYLTSIVTVIGRSKDADIKLFYADGYISKTHCTLFNYEDLDDAQIMDGAPGVSTIDNPNPEPSTSSAGTFINNRKLEPGEKVKLKDEDEVILVRNILKFVYIRPKNKVKDELDATYIPEEFIE